MTRNSYASIAGGELRRRVLKFMVHRPCGANNVNAPCMKRNPSNNNVSCSKRYPQPFRNSAIINEHTDRAEYRRADNGDTPIIRQQVNGEWRDVQISNQWIVPYNAYLLLKYNCHVCCDAVSSTSCVKYLFKYVTKGADMAKARIAGIDSEIEQYRTTRYISAAEATWRLLGFHVLNRQPSVTLVNAHLLHENHVIFPDNASVEERLSIAQTSVSDLMLYFNRPTPNVFSSLTVLDYFERYRITKKKSTEPIHHRRPGA